MKQPLNKLINQAVIFFVGAFILGACMTAKTTSNKIAVTENTPMSAVEQGFQNMPDSIQTSAYWYWISDNISKSGVVKDLEAMKKIGINRAFIGNIGLNPSETSYGNVKIFSDEWYDITHTALKTATDLGIEIGMFNSPGWSQSGGPWIKPTETMRYLASAEILVTGPKKINTVIPAPKPNFQDVRVIAFRAPKDFNSSLNTLNSKINGIPAITAIKNITDKNQETDILFPATGNQTIDFETKTDYTVRSVTVYPAQKTMTVDAEIQVKENNVYRSVKKFKVDRSNTALIVGFDPYGPVAMSIPATTGKNFRVLFSNASPQAGITDLVLSSSPRVENYVEKTLAKMFPTPFPYWKEYQWPAQPIVTENDLIIKQQDVLDISNTLSADGKINWNVPAGDWVIMRTGMLPTGVVNEPASPEGTGLEADKMSKEHVKTHFDAFLGDLLRRIPVADRKTWKVAVEDSYERGGQNWTDGFIEKFKKRYGYDPLPFIPVMKGNVVGSQDISDRFLWDLRRLIADNVAYEYVGGLRDIAHKNGLSIWLENYGHWGFPGEFLQYGGQSDEVAGEFWSEGDLGNIENRAASSAAHIYGKTKVSAESFTAGGKGFARHPAMMKQRGDRFFTEGINNTLLHLFIQQPDDKAPGVNAPFGNEFNRLNTWFYDMDLFIQYIKRCNFMLQQGKYVADVAYFIGEDAPKMTGIQDPELPKGYSFDYINAEVIQNRVSVKNGKLVLPDGLSYSVLVLPKLETMRPELLAKIKELVNQGAVVLGPKPSRSPSFENYPAADQQVQQLATELWGNADGNQVKINKYGQGMVLNGMNMQEAMDLLKVIPDFKTAPADDVLFIHRNLPDGDAYFVSNQSEKEININPEFRLTGKSPEFWNPVNGTIRNLPGFTQNGQSTTVPLKLAAFESGFIVFRKDAKSIAGTSLNFPVPTLITEINTPWQVSFDVAMRGPEKPVIFNKLTDWTKRPEESIKYYSGTAFYSNTFKLAKPQTGERIFLDLGTVTAIAKVKVNAVDAGGVWTPPYKIDITDFIKPGVNQLEIKVVNNWMNRLIGDSKLPFDQRKTFTKHNIYKPDSPLQPSGLMGPVLLQKARY